MSGVRTVTSLRRSRSRLDRRRQAAEHIIAKMQQRGATLHLLFQNGREIWRLSDGASVAPEVAAIVACHPHVAPAGDALFPDTRSQTWHFKPRETSR